MHKLFAIIKKHKNHPKLNSGTGQRVCHPRFEYRDFQPELVSGSHLKFRVQNKSGYTSRFFYQGMTGAFILFWIIVFTTPAISQIEINGSIDFETSYGGKESSFVTNEIVEEFRRPHIGINQFNLFLFAGIDENFFFNGRLQWDTWGTGKLNPLRITLAALSWEPEDTPINFTLGRFVSPFGLYPRRQLASENLFVNAPLAYGYFINISDKRGYWPKAGKEGSYGSSDVGLTTIYFGGYNTGFMANWVIVPELLDLSLTVTNAAPASQQNFTNLQNYAIVGRMGFQPVIFWQQGISFSHGSFMQRASENLLFDRLEKFRQTLIGTDFIAAYAYFELSGEFIYSMWKVPASDARGFQVNTKGDLQTYDLTNYSAYIDLKFEPPFLTGSYIAARYEKMIFNDFTNPVGSTISRTNPWDNNLVRYSAAFGYKLSRNVLFKLAFSEQTFDDSALKKEDFTFRSILTVSM